MTNPLVWSPTPPNAPGWWWVRLRKGGDVRACEAWTAPGGLMISHIQGYFYADTMRNIFPAARFAGPITPPAD